MLMFQLDLGVSTVRGYSNGHRGFGAGDFEPEFKLHTAECAHVAVSFEHAPMATVKLLGEVAWHGDVDLLLSGRCSQHLLCSNAVRTPDKASVLEDVRALAPTAFDG